MPEVATATVPRWKSANNVGQEVALVDGNHMFVHHRLVGTAANPCTITVAFDQSYPVNAVPSGLVNLDNARQGLSQLDLAPQKAQTGRVPWSTTGREFVLPAPREIEGEAYHEVYHETYSEPELAPYDFKTDY